jgi:hypothetical protein
MLERDSALPQWLKDELAGRSVVWVGALSFEPRCVGSLRRLTDGGVAVDQALLVGYPTSVSPRRVDRERRRAHRGVLEELAEKGGIGTIQDAPVRAHAFVDIDEVLARVLDAADNPFLVVDVSCMTKIHAMATAVFLARRGDGVSWTVAYSTPQNYGDLDAVSRSHGWRDVVVGPIADHAFLRNEQFSRGIALLGHESDRFVVGLGELRASGGTVLLADTPGRPDLAELTERKNRKTLEQLERSSVGRWRSTRYLLSDVNLVARLVKQEIAAAQERDAPVVLYPYGPKIAIVTAALTLWREYSAGSWFVCPTPWGYSVEHSQGVESTLWVERAHGASTGHNPSHKV